MSSPHVAGAAALLLQARPKTPSQAVNAILQNSADPIKWFGNPALGLLEVTHRQGAGLLDIDDSILTTTKIEPGKLSLGESEAGPAVRTLTIENNSSSAVTYTLSHAPALATGPNTFAPSFISGPSSVTFNVNPLVVPPGGTATVDVTIAPNAALPDRSLYGGYIVFTTGGAEMYRVPYAGFKGDYQSIQVLVPTAAGFPWLARLVGSSFVKQPSGGTFTLTGGDVPFILVHLDHESRRFLLEVFDANTGRAWHRAEDESYLPRNSPSTSFFAASWDGTTANGSRLNDVPNGSYVIKLTIEKALADENNPAHLETWTSPVITIARP